MPLSDRTQAEKTNVMRILDRAKLPYRAHCYAQFGLLSGIEVAKALNEDASHVFKTLVTQGKTKNFYVFVIPVARELDLKKAAAAVGEKAVAMIPQKELLPLTGYVHGGCSPIGMKKAFRTVLDASAESFETILFSAGKIGYQIEMSPLGLTGLIGASYADVVVM